ncbi:MAG: hypothetical protein ACYTHJ_05810 [Planctomycetota bacterium]
MLLYLASNQAIADTIYVDVNAPGLGGDGLTWCSAFRNLQDALSAAEASGGVVDEIRIADGVYAPDRGANQVPGDRHATFRPFGSLTISGGFAGCGGRHPDHADPRAYESVLSGDLAGNDAEVPTDMLLSEVSRTDNSFHVVTAPAGGGMLVLDGVTIANGNANDFQGTREGGGMVVLTGGLLRLTRCTFAGNSAMDGGGAISAASAASLDLANCFFLGNLAARGGAVYIDSVGATVDKCVFDQNLALETGGAIHASNGHNALTNSDFRRNSALSSGGAIHNENSSDSVLVNCEFNRNRSDGSGGAVANICESAYELLDCRFSNNFAESAGGAIHNVTSSGRIATSLFHGNLAMHGGAISNREWSLPAIEECVFQYNRSELGAGIYNVTDSDAWIYRCEFSENAVVWNGAGVFSEGASPTILACVFTENRARSGAAILGGFNEPLISDCFFYSNTASWKGGGVYSVYADEGTISICVFVANFGLNGGAFCNNQESSPEISECLFVGNTAGSGAAMFNR